MDEIEAFRRLSLCPLSCATLSIAEAAWHKIRDRYPENKPFPLAAAQWASHAAEVSQSHPDDGDDGDGGAKISPSMRRLARGEEIDQEIMQACLGLLRAQSSGGTEISEIRALEQMNDMRDEGINTPTIVPFQDGDGWAFAVAYPDCIHWYDSRHGKEVPRLSAGDRPIIADWAGPKQPRDRPQDSGVLMLMGIRRIHQGAPHLSQDVANEVRPSFRARLLAELRCGKLEPNDKEFSAVVRHGSEEPSFFADAYYGSELTSAVADATRGAPTEPTPSNHEQPTTAAAGGRRSQRGRPGRSLTTPSTRAGSQGGSQASSVDLRMILGYLSDAVLARRSLQASSQTSLAVLWESVRRGAVDSVFHERYNAVLFYDRMKALRNGHEVDRAMRHPVDRHCLTEMRSKQEECQFWRDVCNLRYDWGSGQYTLLLAVPRISSVRRMRAPQREQIVSDLRSRLDDSSDPLERWLKQAQTMCEAITTGALPVGNLMIDLYHLKQQDGITDADYKVFTSVDPHVKRPLPATG